MSDEITKETMDEIKEYQDSPECIADNLMRAKFAPMINGDVYSDRIDHGKARRISLDTYENGISEEDEA